MIEPTLDQRAAAKLGLNPEQVGSYRGEWERSPTSAVVRALLAVKLEGMAKERETKLRTCKPEELLALQGELRGLTLAMDAINGRLI